VSRAVSPVLSWKRAFWAVAIVIAFALPVLSRDFGIVNDDYVHHEHGRILYQWYTGESDRAGKHPYSEAKVGEIVNGYMEPGHRLFTTLNVFGGFFDLAVHAGYDLIGRRLGAGEYEFRRFVNSLFGVLAMLMTGLLAGELAGRSWRAATLGLAFAALSPRFLAHGITNPKDLPFAAFHALALWLLLRWLSRLPDVSSRGWGRALALGLAIGIALDIRIGALLLICYSGGALAWSTLQDPRVRGEWQITWIQAVVGLVAAYLVSVLFWPFAWTHPFEAHLYSFRFLSQFDIFDSFNLFGGRWIHRNEIPWDYLPRWIWITLPPYLSAGVALLPLLIPRVRGASTAERRGFFWVSFATLFPVVWLIVTHANVYDEARHVLFVLPPLMALCAVAWEQAFRLALKANPRAQPAVAACLALLLLEPASWMLRYHPNEAFYFSPLIGGSSGAFKKYELDYWGASLRQAVEWIVANVPPGTPEHPVRVRVWYGDPTSSRYFLEKHPGYKYVLAEEDSDHWDYAILNPSATKFFPQVLENWPPPDTVHQTLVAGAPLNAVIRNFRTTPEGRRRWEHDRALARSLDLYQKGKYRESIGEAEKALLANPRSALAYNNIAASYGALGQFRKEIDACRKALELDPNLQIARNNLAYAQSRLAR
jgi:tetratricopeptide (TPR) repeat protein